MKRIKFFLLLSGMVFLMGCASDREEVLKKAEAQVVRVEERIQNSSEKKRQEAAGMVYATELALEKALDSRAVELARGFNDRAQILIGQPEPADSAQLRRLVSDLLSQIDRERERGIAMLDVLDAKLAAISREREKLKGELVLAERKLSVISQENAVLANREKQREANWWNPFDDLFHSLKKFFIWGGVILFLLLLLPVLAAIFPALLPIVSGMGSFLGVAIGWLMKVIPGAVSGAGLISKKLFELVGATKDRIVDAIEEWQQEQKLTGKTDYKNLGKYLAELLDSENKIEVSETKQKLGWV